MAESEEKKLNKDFNHNMFLARNLLPNLPSMADRQKAVLWLRKLSTSSRTVDEMKLRNSFLYYLLMNIQSGHLCAPFTYDPPVGPLPGVSQLLPGAGCKEQKKPGDMDWEDPDHADSRKARAPPILYAQSPDGGAFLSAQPIPRKGAFCYLAVVTKGDDD